MIISVPTFIPEIYFLPISITLLPPGSFASSSKGWALSFLGALAHSFLPKVPFLLVNSNSSLDLSSVPLSWPVFLP